MLDTPEIGNFLERRHLLNDGSDTPTSGRQSNPLMERFLERGRRDGDQKKKGDDKYPYTCISPWEKDENQENKRKTEKDRPPSRYSDIFSQTATDRPNSYNSAASTVSYVYVDSRASSRQGDNPTDGEETKPDILEVEGQEVSLGQKGAPAKTQGKDIITHVSNITFQYGRHSFSFMLVLMNAMTKIVLPPNEYNIEVTIDAIGREFSHKRVNLVFEISLILYNRK